MAQNGNVVLCFGNEILQTATPRPKQVIFENRVDALTNLCYPTLSADPFEIGMIACVLTSNLQFLVGFKIPFASVTFKLKSVLSLNMMRF